MIMEIIGYGVLAITLIAVIGVFIKILVYALDAINKNDD